MSLQAHGTLAQRLMVYMLMLSLLQDENVVEMGLETLQRNLLLFYLISVIRGSFINITSHSIYYYYYFLSLS